jgi:two-component system CheB/CheR fusion protein
MTREMSSKSSAMRKKPVPRAARRAADHSKIAGSGTTPTASARLRIVGLGASAGGLEALRAFFGAMPAKTRLSFVVVVHLDPTHESLMPELLAKSTTLAVHQAQDRQPLEADHVYIIPPNRSLTIDQGLIRVREVPDRRGLRGSIDHSFGRSPTIRTTAPSTSSCPEPALKAH